jgi:(p)ppGpp synthase/HD superfamily hydrolase
MDIKNTLRFIKEAHKGQIYGDQPYWTHPKRVANVGAEIFKRRFCLESVIAALLHDVIEDTKYDRVMLSELGYSKNVLDAVDLLTKDSSLSYVENIQRIIDSGNRIAMMVKFSDNYTNYHGDKSGWDAERREKSQAKYKKSMEDIGSVLDVENQWIPS